MVEVGQDIYMDSHHYIDHPEDDIEGGLARVTRVEEGISGGKPCIYIGVAEWPGWSLNWSTNLEKEQATLKQKFGNRRVLMCNDSALSE